MRQTLKKKKSLKQEHHHLCTNGDAILVMI
jgi:hypothetical protein